MKIKIEKKEEKNLPTFGRTWPTTTTSHLLWKSGNYFFSALHFTVNIHFFHFFHSVAFSYIYVWPHKQGATEFKSRITVHRATKVNSLDFGFPRVATSLVHLGGDQGPRWRPWLSGDQGATDVGVYTWRALSVKCLWTIGENMVMLVGTIMRT